jgi:hypothetical protein
MSEDNFVFELIGPGTVTTCGFRGDETYERTVDHVEAILDATHFPIPMHVIVRKAQEQEPHDPVLLLFKKNLIFDGAFILLVLDRGIAEKLDLGRGVDSWSLREHEKGIRSIALYLEGWNKK